MLTSGYAAIQDHIEKQKSRGGFVRLNNIFWRDKDRKIIRHLHDDPITILSHNFVKCKDGSEKSFTCRKSLVKITDAGVERDPFSCPLCLVEVEDEKGRHLLKPATVAWGLAIERQLSTNRDNNRVIVDMMEEIDVPIEGKEETKKVSLPKIGVVSQSLGNFWSSFGNFYIRYGTTVDRDYEIVREGGGRGKGAPNYVMIPEDPIDGIRNIQEVQEKYKASLQGKTPREILRDRINFFGSYQYMAKFLDDDVMSKVEWPEVKEASANTGVSESLKDHPGGLDEFASRKPAENDRDGQSFEDLKERIISMASKPKG